MRKVFGSLVSSAVGIAGLVAKLLAQFFGIPGHIDDALTWVDWLTAVPEAPFWFMVSVLIVSGPAIASSGWWWPKVSARHWRSPTGEPPAPAVASSGEVATFKHLAPLIGDLRDALKPDTDLASRFARDLDMVSRVALPGKWDDLLAHLDALQVPYPDGESRKSVWYRYLIRLHVLSEDGDLDGARSLRVEDYDR